MTTSYAPHSHPSIDHGAPTAARRPSMTFVPQVVPEPVFAQAPTWKSGWLVSGLAAAVSVAALGVVGWVAIDALALSPSPEPTSVVLPAASHGDSAVTAPLPLQPAPAIAVTPRLPESAPSIVGAPRVIVIPAPAAAPAPKQDPVVTPPAPVVTPPAPVSQPKPPLGIGTCDLVNCDTTTPAPGIPKCGDLVACDPTPPTPPAPSIPKCGDLVACTGPGSHP